MDSFFETIENIENQAKNEKDINISSFFREVADSLRAKDLMRESSSFDFELDVINFLIYIKCQKYYSEIKNYLIPLERKIDTKLKLQRLKNE